MVQWRSVNHHRGKFFFSRFLSRESGFICASLALGISACSPSVFWSDGKDLELENSKGYRQINPNCSKLNLSTSTVDAPTAKAMVSCLNSNGSLAEVAKLFDRLENNDLQNILDVANEYTLNDAASLFQIEKTLQDLTAKGTLDESFDQLGKLLENEEFVSASIALLNEGLFQKPDELLEPVPRFSEIGSWITRRLSRSSRLEGTQPVSAKANQDVLAALEILSKKVTPELITKLIDYGLSFAGARSFAQAQAQFKWLDPPLVCDPNSALFSDTLCPLKGYTDALLQYTRETGPDKKVEAGKELIERLLDGTLFTALDEIVGIYPDNIRVNTARIASVMDVTLANGQDAFGREVKAEIMNAMTSLFHYLNGPIRCLGGSKQVPNGVMYVMRELTLQNTEDAATYIKKTNPLLLQAMDSFCDYPPQLATFYPVFSKLADRMAVQPAADLIKSMFRVQTRTVDATGNVVLKRPLADLMVRLLSDTGDGDRTGMKHLLPVMSAINEKKRVDVQGNERSVWQDLLLVTSLIRVEDRAEIQDAIRFIVASREELGGKSIYDVMTEAVSKTSPMNLYRLVYSLRRYVNQDEPILVPALTTLRSGLYVNDAHPLLDNFKRMAGNARKHEKAFKTIFKIAEYPEFREVIGMVSRMARRGDGRLKDLLNSVVSIFHNFARKGYSPISPDVEPPYIVKRRHDLAAADLVPFPNLPAPSQARPECALLNPSIPLSDVTGPHFKDQMDAMLACVNYDGKSYQNVVDAVDFLRNEEDLRQSQLLRFARRHDSGLQSAQENAGFLVDKWIQAVDDGPFFIIRSSIFFFSKLPGMTGPGDAASV